MVIVSCPHISRLFLFMLHFPNPREDLTPSDREISTQSSALEFSRGKRNSRFVEAVFCFFSFPPAAAADPPKKKKITTQSNAGIRTPAPSMCFCIYYCQHGSNNTVGPHGCSPVQMRWCVAWWASTMPKAKEAARPTNDAGRMCWKWCSSPFPERLGEAVIDIILCFKPKCDHQIMERG